MPIPVWDWSDVFVEIGRKYPHRFEDFAQSFAENQWSSKTWMIEQLKIHDVSDQRNLKFTIMGSWYGTLLVPLIRQSFKNVKEIVMIDYDEETLELAKFVNRFNDPNLIKYVQKDLNFDYDRIENDVIINTSCEHMYPMKDFDIKGLCVFQSNNFRKELAHINCVDSVEELIEQSGLTQIDYKGERQFHKWETFSKRFMVIGKK